MKPPIPVVLAGGIAVEGVGVKDIILPGDMKVLLGKVVEAEKAAQANVIRRREETNATRSLLNTAKVMESNAVALRLEELETLEKITEKVGSLSVYGGLDGVLNERVRLKASTRAALSSGGLETGANGLPFTPFHPARCPGRLPGSSFGIRFWR